MLNFRVYSFIFVRKIKDSSCLAMFCNFRSSWQLPLWYFSKTFVFEFRVVSNELKISEAPKRRCSFHKANRNQVNTPRKFILSLIDLRVSRSDQQQFLLCCYSFFSGDILKDIWLPFRRVTHVIALDFISHIWKFNAGIKCDPNKTISDHRCVMQREIF